MAGILHIDDEHGWLVVDLTQARVAADVRFEASGMGNVYAARAVRSADGRLVLADDRGQVLVVHPTQQQRPKRSCSAGANSVLVIDEAGMAGTRHLHELITAAPGRWSSSATRRCPPVSGCGGDGRRPPGGTWWSMT